MEQRLLALQKKQLSTWHSRHCPKLMSRLKPVMHLAQMLLSTQLVQFETLQVMQEAAAMLSTKLALQAWQTSLCPVAQVAQLGMLQRRLQVSPKRT